MTSPALYNVKYLPTLPSLLIDPGVPLIHRDLSWLQFNDRVLAEAKQAANPLFERAKFLAISSSNLDEFFMIRFASMTRMVSAASRDGDPSRVNRLKRIRSSVLENVSKFVARQTEIFDLLSQEMKQNKIRVFADHQGTEIDAACAEAGKRIFDRVIFPALNPPESVTLSQVGHLESLQCAVIFPEGIWFRIPKNLPTYYVERDEATGWVDIFFLDYLLQAHLGPAFRFTAKPGLIRVTRDGDFVVNLDEEDTESIPDVVRSGLGNRERGRIVRLQYAGEVSQQTLNRYAFALRLDSAQVFPVPHTLLLQGLWAAVNQIPNLKYDRFESVFPRAFRSDAQIFSSLKERDLLLHHPYDSFEAYVAWIQSACSDPEVTAIEQTIYRTDAVSPLIQSLKTAAKTKKVRVVIELRARFDELNNLRLADELRKAGVEVSFGFGKLKLHAKISLVTRKEGDQTRLYTHLSTGNYHSITSRQYTDLAIMTSDPDIGSDARLFFDAVWEGKVPTAFKRLVSAPLRLHRRISNLIDAETSAARAGQKARVVAKVNALVDEAIIEKLYQASQAGVKIDLIVRGACSLVPGIKGLSENIRVISVVDRFLEHSRIYYFESSRVMYLSSADWMPRNFFSRLEIAFPVLDSRIYSYLEQVVIPAYMSDTVKARELTPQGVWKRRVSHGLTAIRSQFHLEEIAQREYKGTPLE